MCTLNYYKAFRDLAEICGQYAHKTKLQRNAIDGASKAQVVAYQYYGNNASDKLDDVIGRLEWQMKSAMDNLNYWSREAGFKPMSTPEDVEKYHLDRRADTEILAGYLANADFRKRLYYRIDKYMRKGELKSAAELVDEIKKSYKKAQKA